MSGSDYELHLNRAVYDSLFEDEDERGFPFGEDDDEIARAIDEEIGNGKKRKTKKKRAR